MQVSKFALYFVVWFIKVINAIEPSATPSADLESKFKRISATLQTLDKIREDNSGSHTKRSERGQTNPPVLFQNRQQFFIPDEGSGLSDDDDYPGSGMNSLDDEDETSGNGLGASEPKEGDEGILVVDNVPTSAGTTTRLIEQITSKSISTLGETTLSSTSMLATSKSTVRVTTMRPTQISSSRKPTTVSHIESPDYGPKRNKSNSMHWNSSFSCWKFVLILLLSSSIRWL